MTKVRIISKAEKLAKLRTLQIMADAIREQLGISATGRVLYQSALPDDSLIVVKADGIGGATTLVVEGNYPIDYMTKFDREFATEREAEDVAEQIAAGKLELA